MLGNSVGELSVPPKDVEAVVRHFGVSDRVLNVLSVPPGAVGNTRCFGVSFSSLSPYTAGSGSQQ